jgi:nicotinamide-nucleotide amidase
MNAFPDELCDTAGELLTLCREAGVMLATAESCTGGLIIGCLTEVAGSSAVVDRGFVTYSNEAKNEMLGVPMELIIEHGAVSGPVARAMAEGALARSRACLTIAVTGVAGPGGGTETKPVGLVHFGCASSAADTEHARHVFKGTRAAVRLATLRTALAMLRARIIASGEA